MTGDRIDLAHTPGFQLGWIAVRPGTRELVRDDGIVEVLEPRVMQVLVALARADGGIVSRDDLTQLCWDGRVVGEDAINRVMSRLRRSAEGIGEGSFRVETITKVGFRLLVDGAANETEAAPAPAQPSALPSLDRRWLIGGGVAIAGLAALGIGTTTRGDDSESPPIYPSDVAALIDQAQYALCSGSPESVPQAIGFLREVTVRRPDIADGWGLLAIAYAIGVRRAPSDQIAAMTARSRAAAEQALRLDPTNVYAPAAGTLCRRRRGQWLRLERDLRAAFRRRPDTRVLRYTLGSALASVGRSAEHADLFIARELDPRPTPLDMYTRAVVLWSANRLEQADRAMDEAFALFPMDFTVWFTRFFLLLHTGRPMQAITMGEDVEGRPAGVPQSSFAPVLAVARAMASRDPAAIDAVIAEQRALAGTGAGFAQNAMQFAAALGRVDDAFAIIDAYYFGRGFRVPDVRFPDQHFYDRLDDRPTHHLFHPPLARARADPRFARLVEELELARYWRESGITPDYRRGAA